MLLLLQRSRGGPDVTFIYSFRRLRDEKKKRTSAVSASWDSVCRVRAPEKKKRHVHTISGEQLWLAASELSAEFKTTPYHVVLLRIRQQTYNN